MQGTGVRPALARLAAKHAWNGRVRNTSDGVECLLQGHLPDDQSLQSAVIDSLPVPIDEQQICIDEFRHELPPGFQIAASSEFGPLTAEIPLDRAICKDCLEDIRDPHNRRFQYPFTTCAQCGPRYSLLLDMPFDRERTTMRVFAMCDECRREYASPTDRRFHAQTISCPQCGPRIWVKGETSQLKRDALSPWDIAADFLRQGLIVAVRGIGGYQLLADATSDLAIQRLRQRKARLAKPFAVMCRDLTEAQHLAEMSPLEAEQLTSPINPIVVARQRFPTLLAREVNAGLNEIGLFLPSTALHQLLLDAVGRPLVCTSGNREGDPLAASVEDAERTLADIADLFLHHDREIIRPIDDSVVRVMAGRVVTLRAARGIAPRQIPWSPSAGTSAVPTSLLLATGGQQKGAVALFNGAQAVLGPHLGDLETIASQDHWVNHVAQFSRLVLRDEFNLEIPAACDSHPEYYPSQWAHSRQKSTLPVWHHHAHIVTGMLEHGWLDREVLGVAWDGTGLGPDGTIWGGEFLHASSTSFERIATFRPFHLPGGEAAIHDVRRIAFALLSQLPDLPENELMERLRLSPAETDQWKRLLRSEFSPSTTSCGRLFDAAACLILDQDKADFEGHAAMLLESVCDVSTPEAYSFSIKDESPIQIDWRPAFSELLADRRNGNSRGIMAMKFHRGLANVIREVAKCDTSLPVVLGGGVFQNRVLVELVAENWPTADQPLGLPGMLPPNDGGLAAGQLAIAMSRTVKEI